MGDGKYSVTDRAFSSTLKGYDTKPMHQIFTAQSIERKMNPQFIENRESRDSEEHPNSVPIILGLDVTGSMGTIPHYLIKDGLPLIMGSIIQLGIKDPQLLFLAIGDHECDKSPLQVGQFESSDELIDEWLTSVYIEGGGGGNNGESYLLAWLFAGLKTSIDSFEKRNEKGFLFTIGDEPTLNHIPKEDIVDILGNGQYKDYSSVELLTLVKEKYHVFHLHLKQGFHGRDPNVINGWKQILGDNLIVIDNKEDVSKVIPEIIKKNTKNTIIETSPSKPKKEDKEEEIIL